MQIYNLSVEDPTGQLLHIYVQWFQGGLVFKAYRLLYHSTLGLRVTKKKKKNLQDGSIHL